MAKNGDVQDCKDAGGRAKKDARAEDVWYDEIANASAMYEASVLNKPHMTSYQLTETTLVITIPFIIKILTRFMRLSLHHLKKQQGFTLIELVVVIVVLGLLAATALPKFIDLSENAEEAVFSGIASAFKSGVEQVHIAWLIRGNNQAVQNFITISDPIANGDLSVNSAGWPADTRGTSLTLNSEDDCLDVWRAVLDSQDALVAGNNSTDFEAVHNNGSCTYTYNKQPTLTVDYDSNTGEININI